MSTPASVLLSKCDYWMRTGLALELCVKDALISILHNSDNDLAYQGLLKDENALYLQMVQFKTTYQQQLRKVIRANQWNILCPSSGKSNAKDWDITLIVVVIRYATNLEPPVGGWEQKVPMPLDNSKAAFCLLARDLRNEVNHGTLSKLSTQAQFDKFWHEIKSILTGLHYKNMQLFDDLETGTLKYYTANIVKVLENEVFTLKLEFQTVDDNKDNIQDNENRLNKVKTITKDNVKKLADLGTSLLLLNEILEDVTVQYDIDIPALANDIKNLSQRVYMQQEQYEDHENRLQNLENISNKETEATSDDKHLNASSEVLNLVALNIGKDWKCLADNLDLKCSMLYHLQPSNEKETLNCFRKMNIIWHKLKRTLETLKRYDIIDMIFDRFSLPSDDIHTTNHSHCSVQSHGSVEISEVNQQHKLKLLKENDMITYISCGEQNTITLNKWDKRCTEYFQRYYEQQKKLLFPPPKGENMFHEELTKKLLSYLDPEDGKICLFYNYDLLNHFRLHIGSSETYKQILNDLLISSDEELGSSKNRLLLFNIKHNIILNIRITESTDISSISKEEGIGRSDLKLLLFLNRRFIKTTGITLANVVLCPKICINDSSVCCKKCIVLDQSILNTGEDNFRKWWKAHIFPKTELKDQNSNTNLFSGIISTIFGFMGTKQVNVKDGCFPKFRRDNTMKGEEHMEITNMMFTYDQSRIIDDPAKKKIVFGGFGVGKSLIGQCQLQELAKQEANKTTHTFYICWDDRSIRHLEMKNMVEEVKKTIANQNFYSYNLRELAEEYLKLPKIPSISKLLEEIHLKCGDTAHLIIDEFNLETLDNNQVTSLNKTFKNDEWKPSVVMLLPQSLEKKHTIMADGKEDSKSENTAYRCIDNMECFTLSQHMRSTKSNFDFHKLSTTIITTTVTNSINHPSLHSESQTPTEINLFDDVARKGDLTTISDVGEVADDNAARKEDVIEHLADERDEIEIIKESVPDLLFQAPADLDELQIYKTNSDYPNRTDTVYSSRESEIGHGIEGNKPKFIYFDHIIEKEAESCAKLILVLQNLFSSNFRRLWLCKFHQDFQLCLKILELLDKNYINYHPLSGYRLVDGKGNSLTHIPEGYDLITNNKGARGLEYQQVVVFIPSGNPNQQQAFLETISRCTTQLFIIYPDQFDINDTQLMPPIIHETLSKAITGNIIQECIICDRAIDDTNNVINHISSNGKEYFHINHLARKYKQLNSRASNINPTVVVENESYSLPFEEPHGLKCTFQNSTEAVLTWHQGPYEYIVMSKKNISGAWEFISKPISDSSYTFRDLVEREEYVFSVLTTSTFGKSRHAQISYSHIDVPSNDLESSKITNVQMSSLSKTSCQLTWNGYKDVYTIESRVIGTNNWTYVGDSRTNKYIFEDFEEHWVYEFRISHHDDTSNQAVASLVSLHGLKNMLEVKKLAQQNLSDVVWNNDLETLKTTIDIFPWRLYDEVTHGLTLYHEAAGLNKSSILEYMLHVDISYINKVNRLNQTPLYRASLYGHIDCVDILLSRGADCSVLDKAGQNAYDVACKWISDKSNKEKMKEMLLYKMKD